MHNDSTGRDSVDSLEEQLDRAFGRQREKRSMDAPPVRRIIQAEDRLRAAFFEESKGWVMGTSVIAINCTQRHLQDERLGYFSSAFFAVNVPSYPRGFTSIAPLRSPLSS
jgi:hypothetical protein